MLELYRGAKSRIRFVTQEEIYGKSYEDIPRRVPDNTKMRRLLGVQPQISLKEGTTTTMEWFRREANA
jgi:UDP-glucose 4-epimerase